MMRVENMKQPRVALMQPTFLPWLGYFGLIYAADIFVFLDDFQFSRRSFQQRNRLFVDGARVDWVTIPVQHKGTQACAIRDVVPMLSVARKMLKGMERNYRGTPFFQDFFSAVEGWLSADWPDLASFNIAFITMASSWLGLETVFHRSSGFKVEGKCSERLAGLLDAVGAQTYLSARGSFSYMEEEGVFPLVGVETCFQEFVTVSYEQRQAKEFESHLSVLDAVLQVGPDAARRMIAAASAEFRSWDSMASDARQEDMNADEFQD